MRSIQNKCRETDIQMDAETVVRTYSNMVYRVAMRYVGNATDADDVYSEVFLRYFKKERNFESEEHRKAWLIKVTMNCSKDLFADRHPYEDITEMQIEQEDNGPASEEIIDLRNAIKQLKPEYREAITMYYIEGLSVREISELLDRPENTVKSHLKRGRESLKAALEAADKAV
ncbi:MAG: sigma-70 family RNA polymerase sigma factor [Lachnospiraceae bacterium]|nr:sigma-70 family RNA polymerase sigma factor [Lachnospiraceae bacterium]